MLAREDGLRPSPRRRRGGTPLARGLWGCRTTREDLMSAIDMLEAEHREVERLFEKFESAKGARQQRAIFNQVADKLAVHAAIEEQHFYPAAKADDTEDLLLEAAEEH